MAPKRVLITGASGFIGSRLCEVMALTESFLPRAFIHSTGSAARIARFPIEFVIGDLCDSEAVDRAMRGCEAVVHLARGSDQVMTKGLENVLRAAIVHRISRFVHMSSVAVYGNNPPPESVSEAAPLKRTSMEYGNQKLRQETRVLRYHRRYGLPVVILRPPNVYGPFSSFTLGLIHKIRSGRMAIVDGGSNPCNLVYVDNLIQAILLALWKMKAVGEAFFITDSETISWERCLNDYGALLGMPVPRVVATDLVSPPRKGLVWDSVTALPRVLLSPECRRVLREIPLVKSLESTISNKLQSLSPEIHERIRLGLNNFRRNSSNEVSPCFDASDNIIAAQARRVTHSIGRAARLLGYEAPVSYHEGMDLTKAWLRYSRVI